MKGDAKGIRPVKNSFVAYLTIRPANVMSAFRLYIDYIATLLIKLLHLRRRMRGYIFPGSFTPGNSLLALRALGVKIFARPRSSDLFIISGQHEPYTDEIFSPKRGQIVIDVGAHLGRYSLIAARAGAKVIAIEPNEYNFTLLVRNIAANGFKDVTCLNVAVGDSKGLVTLRYFVDDPATSSTVKEWLARARRRCEQKSVRVPCERLDSIIKDLKIPHIDWLKIDVEGNETQVLKGGMDALQCTHNLILEVARGNESRCYDLVRHAGLALIFIEEGPEVSNWYLRRVEH